MSRARPHPRQLYDFQRDALLALDRELRAGARSVLMRMACGSGKTVVFDAWTRRLLRTDANHQAGVDAGDRSPARVVIVVLPSLPLMEQYQRDYLQPWSEAGEGAPRFLRVCSLQERQAEQSSSRLYTTDAKVIRAFLSDAAPRPALVAVTYQSFDTLAAQLVRLRRPVEHIVHDEAHWLGGPTYCSVVLQNEALNALVRHRSFWTASPYNNRHVTMYPTPTLPATVPPPTPTPTPKPGDDAGGSDHEHDHDHE